MVILSSMLLVSSGTREARSTIRTIPVPEQVGHAPAELNDSCSADGGCMSWLQDAHRIGNSAATFIVGRLRTPQCSQTCEAQRENNRRRLLSNSVIVPNVDRTPGTEGL